MPCYQDKTDKKEIQRQIDENLQNTEAAEDVVQLVANLCWETDIQPDPMSQWLALLIKHVPKVQKWKTSADRIEIYPSGTHGVGKNDRLLMQVQNTEVEIIEAYKSEH